MADIELERALSTVNDRFPVLGNINATIRRGTGHGHAEFFPSSESLSPTPGVPLIEVRNPDIKGKWLESLIAGELMHELPLINNDFRKLRDDFVKTLNKRQMLEQEDAYQFFVSHPDFQEEREFKDWFEISRIDGLIRGYLFPDEQNNFKDFYTDENIEVLDRMRDYIRGIDEEEGGDE
jgi:hypothetical protein|tara:strand:+ start:4787 stop:5323 length:537 start_codon:yes stop_codon:yes gene_type:complete